MAQFDIFCYGPGILVVVLHTLMMLGLFREWRKDKALCTRNGPQMAATPKVAVIIPVHNESRRMAGLLHSLLAQDYPAEIIFVDDRSDDTSPAMLAQFVQNAAERGISCRVITLTENPGPNHKQYALSMGIAAAQGDYLLFTDGDCKAPAGWIRAMVSRMDEDVGAVIGPVFKKKQGRGFFFRYQCYDHAMRYNYLAGAAGLGNATGGFGNNLMVSRAALDAIGGYEAVPPSPTEDAALISLIRSCHGKICHGKTCRKCRIRAAVLPDAAIETDTEQNWRGFISQTLRWNNGGLFSPEPLTRCNFNLLMLLNLAGIFAVPLLPFFPGLWPLSAGVLIGTFTNAIAIFGLFREKLPSAGPLNLGYLPAMLFTPIHFALITLMGYCGVKVKWKGKIISHVAVTKR